MEAIEHQIRAELILHTEQAIQLLRGYKKIKYRDTGKYKTVGLWPFGFAILKISQQIKQDDPYAESILIETERRLDNAFKFIHRKHNEIDIKLDRELPGLKFEIYSEPCPNTTSLNSIIFSMTHTNLAARLIGVYDLLVRKLITCKKYAIISRRSFESQLNNAGKTIRGALSAPMAYQKLNIKRKDILEQTPIGLIAIKKLGILPAEILNKKTHSTFGPKPPKYL